VWHKGIRRQRKEISALRVLRAVQHDAAMTAYGVCNGALRERQ